MPSIELEILAATKSAEKSIKDFGTSATKSLGSIEKSFGMIKTVAIAAVGYLAGREVISFFKESVAAAAEQEAALNELNVALALTGKYSDEASKDLSNFADSLQATTIYQDEAILSTAAYIQQLGNLSTQGLKDATASTLDLASALGIDLETASSMVAKAATGNVTAFQKLGIEIKKGKTDAETFSNTLNVLEKRFAGAAAASTNTFSGAMTQLGNAFDNVKESIGDIIVKNPVVIKGIKLLSQMFSNLSEYVQKNSSYLMELINRSFIGLLKIIPVIIKGMSGIIKVLDYLADAFAGFAYTVINAFSKIIHPINTIKDSFKGIGLSVKSFFNAMVGDAEEAQADLAAALAINPDQAFNVLEKEGLSTIGKLSAEMDKLAASTDNFISELGSGEVQKVGKGFQEISDNSKNIGNETEKVKGKMEKVAGVVGSISGGFKSTFMAVLSNAGFVGQIISGIVNVLSMSKKEFKGFVDSFLKMAMDMPITIAENVPVLMNSILKSLPRAIKQAFESILPNTIGLVEGILGAVLSNLPKLLKKLPRVLISSITSFIANLSTMLTDIVNMVIQLFADADMITGMVKAIPELVMALTMAFSDPSIIGPLITNLSIYLPLALVQAFGDPYFTENVIKSFAKELSRFTMESFSRDFKQMWSSLIGELESIKIRIDTTQIKSDIESVQAKIKIKEPDWLDKLKISTPKWVEGFVNALNSFVGSGGKGGDLLKFARGGLVYAQSGLLARGTDTVPAMLSPGELVVPRNTVSNLFGLINDMASEKSGSVAGGETNLTINLKVGEKQLADVLLNLNRQGFRVA